MAISKETPVFEIMTRNLVVAGLKTKLNKAQELFMEYNVSHLPIMNEDVLVGIVSEYDIMKTYVRLLEKHGTITKEQMEQEFDMEKVMTSNPVTISSRETIANASKILAESTFKALPVVDNGDLVGLVTSRDMVTYLSEIYL